MSSNEGIEKHLAAAPGRTLSPDAMQEIVSSLLAAERQRARPWWRGRVPLWQAAAACVVVGVLTFGLVRQGQSYVPSGAVAETEPPRFVSVDTSRVFAKSEFSYPTDITRWRVQDRTGSTRPEEGRGAP